MPSTSLTGTANSALAMKSASETGSGDELAPMAEHEATTAAGTIVDVDQAAGSDHTFADELPSNEEDPNEEEPHPETDAEENRSETYSGDDKPVTTSEQRETERGGAEGT